jgi:hypothetical protein
MPTKGVSVAFLVIRITNSDFKDILASASLEHERATKPAIFRGEKVTVLILRPSLQHEVRTPKLDPLEYHCAPECSVNQDRLNQVVTLHRVEDPIRGNWLLSYF